MAKQETVLAVRASAFKAIIQEVSGFISETNLDKLFHPKDVIIASREWLENDSDWLQLIGYTAIKNKSDEILLYSRTTSGGENRLYDKLSVGFGGHTSLSDIESNELEIINLIESVKYATSRELFEELGVEVVTFDIKSHGLIWDFTDDVGLVHLGLLSSVTIDSEIVNVEDSAKLLGFKSKEEITYSYYPSLEKWSQIAVKQL